MKSLRIQAPGTCGELIQGRFGGHEQLVSFAIDRYSTATFTDQASMTGPPLSAKTQMARRLFEQRYQVSDRHLTITMATDIPIGKGMASSTADILAVLAGMGLWHKIPLTADDLAQMACQIEPSDSIMFKDWTLFDHIRGQAVESFTMLEDLEVLVLEMDHVVDTKQLRASGVFDSAHKPEHSRSLSYLRQASSKRDYHALGRAIITSACENQMVLAKPHLEELIDLALQNKLWGMNTAHSGTVVGAVYSPSVGDIERFTALAQAKGYLKAYPKRAKQGFIAGGPKVIG